MRINRTIVFIAVAAWLLTGMPLLIAWLAFDWQQLVEKPAKISNADVRRIRQEIEEYNPLNLIPGQIDKLLINERDINLLIAAQPTRGLDVGSIEFIHSQIIERRDSGVAVLLVSAELDEILSLADRIGVMYEGALLAVVDRADATREDIGVLMAGGGVAA